MLRYASRPVSLFPERCVSRFVLVFVSRIVNTIFACIAVHFITIKFAILPAGTAATLFTTALGVALSEAFFHIFRGRG
ncbi:hypothetical protein C6Q05_11645 [Burkholderia multivorans]|nr:hypothetical protein C6Q05_11645 [Burkholderia multivorans]